MFSKVYADVHQTVEVVMTKLKIQVCLQPYWLEWQFTGFHLDALSFMHHLQRFDQRSGGFNEVVSDLQDSFQWMLMNEG